VLGDEVEEDEPYRKNRPVDFKKWITRKPVQSVHPSLRFVDSFDARDILNDLGGKKNPKIAMIHPEVLKNRWYENMSRVLGDFTYFDIGIPLDAVRVVKGEEETYLIRQVNKMNEKLMAAAGQVIRPGRSLKEITDEFQYLAMRLGSGGHFVHVFCVNVGPQDEPSPDGMARRPYPGITLQMGDRVFLLIETNGPGGHYSALGRYCILGEPSEEMKKYWDMAVKAQKNAARMMKPGVCVREISDENYKYITEACGFQTNHQNYLHSLGFQYGEQPYLNAPSERTPLRAGMHYIAHPVIERPYPGTDQMDGIFCLDTYTVTENGGVRDNDFPQDLIVLR
jgi:Xaa-Pro aminopeptidase